MRLGLFLSFSFLMFGGSGPLLAADECKDVLVNAVFNTKSVKWDSYVSTSIISDIDASSDKAKSSSADFGIPIDGIPFSIGVKDAARVRTNLSQHYNFQAVRKEVGSLLLMSGQEAIIGAWKTCMTGKSQLGVRFEPLDGRVGRQTLIHIEYFRPGGTATADPPSLTLAEDVYLDPGEVTVKAGAACLKKGRIFNPGDSCTVQLVVSSAWAVVPLVLSLKSASTEFARTAYLPPRAEMIGETEPWADQTGLYVYDNSKWGDWKCSDAQDGYVFIENSIRQQLTPGGAAMGRQSCKGEYALDELGKKLCIRAGIIGVPVKGDWYCTARYTASKAAVRWDPPPPATGGAQSK